MWTGTTGKHYERNNGRYASDLTDEEWKVIERFIPKAGSLGRPCETDMREVIKATYVGVRMEYTLEGGFGRVFAVQDNVDSPLKVGSSVGMSFADKGPVLLPLE